jgi:hypothetical protein
MCAGEVEQYNLELNYKGRRDYIQGGDIYNACSTLVAELFGTKYWVNKIKFQGFVNAGAYITFDKEGVEKKDVKAFFTIDGLTDIGYVIEAYTEVTARIPYDESLVTDNAIVTGELVRQESKSDFSAIEEVIALTKHLHNTTLPSEDGRWIFTELSLNERLCKNKSLVSIKLAKNLNNMYTVSDIIEDSNSLGKIKFTLFK